MEDNEYYTQNYTVLASDMDYSYRMTPNAIMLYFQDCFARYLTSKHLAAFDIIKEDLIWVITELQVHFLRERPFWASHIQVRMRFTEISAIRINVDYAITDTEGKPYAEGTSVWVIINSHTKRPVAAQPLLDRVGIKSSSSSVRKTPMEKSSAHHPSTKVEHQVNVTDLDFNGHVCNRTYLTISLATQPVEFISSFSPRYIGIRFVRESFFGDTLTIEISKEGDERYWYDIVNGQGKPVCHIYSEWENREGKSLPDISELVAR